MEIGHDHIHNAEAETGHNNDARAYFQFRQAIVFQILDYSSKGVIQTVWILSFIRRPLSHIPGFTLLNAGHSYIVQRFQGSHRGSSHRNEFFAAWEQIAQEFETHDERLPVHGMLGNQGAFNGKEGAGTYVKTYRLHIYTLIFQAIEHIFREMQPGSRCSHGSADVGI